MPYTLGTGCEEIWTNSNSISSNIIEPSEAGFLHARCSHHRRWGPDCSSWPWNSLSDEASWKSAWCQNSWRLHCWGPRKGGLKLKGSKAGRNKQSWVEGGWSCKLRGGSSWAWVCLSFGAKSFFFYMGGSIGESLKMVDLKWKSLIKMDDNYLVVHPA